MRMSEQIVEPFGDFLKDPDHPCKYDYNRNASCDEGSGIISTRRLGFILSLTCVLANIVRSALRFLSLTFRARIIWPSVLANVGRSSLCFLSTAFRARILAHVFSSPSNIVGFLALVPQSSVLANGATG
jgi:branched-subunit amino acid transport protein